MTIRCPNPQCGAELVCDESLVGQEVACSQCNFAFVVEVPAELPATPAAEPMPPATPPADTTTPATTQPGPAAAPVPPPADTRSVGLGAVFRWLAEGTQLGLRYILPLSSAVLIIILLDTLSFGVCVIPGIFVGPPLAAGFALMLLAAARRERGVFAHLFGAFGGGRYWPVIGLSLLLLLILWAASIPTQVLIGVVGLSFLANLLQNNSVDLILYAVLFTAGLAPYLFFVSRLAWAVPLCAEGRAGAGESLGLSWRLTGRVARGFGLFVMMFVQSLLSVMAVVLILGAAFAVMNLSFLAQYVQMTPQNQVAMQQDPGRMVASAATSLAIGGVILTFLAAALVGILAMPAMVGYRDMVPSAPGNATLERDVRAKEAYEYGVLPSTVREDGSGRPRGSPEIPGPDPSVSTCSQCGHVAETDSYYCRFCGSQLHRSQLMREMSARQPIAPSEGGANDVPPATMQPTPLQVLAKELDRQALARREGEVVPSVPDTVIQAGNAPHSAVVQMFYPGRVQVGAPVPSAEELLWEGKLSFWYFVPGILWAALWVVLWVKAGVSMASQFTAWQTAAPKDWQELATFLARHGAQITWLAYGFALLAGWGIVRRILEYSNAYVQLTTQRVKFRMGILAQKQNQIELFRLKDAELERSLWGRIFNYAHIRLISSDRFAAFTMLKGIPGGEAQLEMIRRSAQQVRPESGLVHISE
jgi:hypothetical protein